MAHKSISRNGPGNQLPIKHNQKKPFNPNKFGKLWSSIATTLMKGSKAKNPQGEANQPLICTLHIDNKRFELTHSETNRLIEELHEAQSTYKKALRMGMLDANSGTPDGYHMKLNNHHN
tara:strand:+ start:288 stop:644 length:357 start_codon:yes stop_codon:yes gene_type:complete